MEFLVEGLKEALRLLATGDKDMLAAVRVSVLVSFASTLSAALLGLPLGCLVAMRNFRGRRLVQAVLNTLMGLPTVVVGLVVFSILCRRGPLGELNLLFTRAAMAVGQCILATPIIGALTASALKGVDPRAAITARALGAAPRQSTFAVLAEARFGILAAVAAGFGRVFAEVGVSMMVGGNIHGYTRSITTAIALETSRGQFALGLALGIVLVAVALIVNVLLHVFQEKGRWRRQMSLSAAK